MGPPVSRGRRIVQSARLRQSRRPEVRRARHAHTLPSARPAASLRVPHACLHPRLTARLAVAESTRCDGGTSHCTVVPVLRHCTRADCGCEPVSRWQVPRPRPRRAAGRRDGAVRFDGTEDERTRTRAFRKKLTPLIDHARTSARGTARRPGGRLPAAAQRPCSALGEGARHRRQRAHWRG